MPTTDAYVRRVALLVQVLPFVAQERDFALKGGTAINLFIRDLPRLSVDIDLTFLPVADRATSLTAIDTGLRRISDSLRASVASIRVLPVVHTVLNVATKVLIQAPGAQVKIEVTPVMRGCVFEPTEMEVTAAVEERFGYARALVVSFEDLYGGKLVAALDRQHPRDLFDVRLLLANEGINDRLRCAFIAHLISHRRSIADVLDSRPKALGDVFATEFAGMIRADRVTAEDLVETRAELARELISNMPDAHREFLVGFKRGEADWALLDVPAIRDLPAVRWKMQNLDRLPPSKRTHAVERLKEVLRRS